MVEQATGTIFVVDDDDMMRKLHGRILEAHGYCVWAFSGARECLSAALAQPPDCIVTDLQMPTIDGAQLIRELRRLGCTVPVIVVTAAREPSIQLDQARRAGAYRIFPKPVSRPELLGAIAEVLVAPARFDMDVERPPSPA